MKNISSKIKGLVPFLLLQILLVVFSANRVSAQLSVTVTSSTGTDQVCQGTNATLTANAENGVGDPSGYSYVWSVTSGDPSILGGTITYIAIINTSAAPGLYTLRCDVTDDDSNTAWDELTIEILQSPIASISAGGATTFCDGNSVLLSAVTDPSYSYQWRRGLGYCWSY